MEIKINLNPIKETTYLPYLGRKITYNNSYWEALYSNLWKAQRIWEIVEEFLEKMGSPIKERAMM